MKRNPPNARFWVYPHCGSPVKLTLRPGQELTTYYGWRHEEGWSAEGDTWTHGGDHVRHEHFTDGCDCDGRLSTTTICTCPLDLLIVREPTTEYPRSEAFSLDYTVRSEFLAAWEGVRWPDWQRQPFPESHQRDYAAEAMGY